MRPWIPAFAMMLVSVISYIDRNTLAILSPTILKETGLSTEQYGYIVSVFSFAYMAGNPIWGWLLDRLGVRRGMLMAVSIWTVASAAHAFARGFISFATARGVLGFGEGATFPGGLRTVMQSLPVASRSRGVAIAYSGGSLGAVITPWIVTPIAAYYGWRGAFWFTGLVGLIWLIVWSQVSRRPELSQVHKAEDGVGITARPGLTDQRLWSFMSLYALGGMPLAFVLYYAAIYWSRVMAKSQGDLAYVLWIPPLGWEIGYFFWGWQTDNLPRGRMFYRAQWKQIVLLTLLGTLLALVPRMSSYPLTIGLMWLSMFVGAGFVIAAMSYVTRIYSVRNSGLIAGLGAGSWSAIVALSSPVTGRLFDQHNYQVAFLIPAVVPIAGFAIFSVLNRRLIWNDVGMQQTNSIEVEVKIAVADLAAVGAQLSGLGFTPGERKFESNAIWDTRAKGLRESGEIVRLREYGEQRVVTYKGPAQSGKHKKREELESDLTSLAPLERIFTRLGLEPSFRYEKYRTEYQRQGSPGVVTLDETPIGNFIELEGAPEWIDRTAHELGFPESSYLTASYATLYEDHCAATGVPVEHMTFAKPSIP